VKLQPKYSEADMRTIPQQWISPTVLSGALITLSLAWFVSAYVFSVTNEQSKDGVFGAPVWALLLLALVPLSTFVLAPWLLRARRGDGQRLRAVDYFALSAAIAPFVFIGVLFLLFYLHPDG